MSIKSLFVAAMIGFSGLALSGCVEGTYYRGYSGYGGYYGGYGGYYDSIYFGGPRYGRGYYSRDYYGRGYGRRYYGGRRWDYRGNRHGWNGRPGMTRPDGHRAFIPRYRTSYSGGSGRSHQ
ncbi:hypothetical protein ACTJJ7_04265 [Phyllobacterium sp. 22229]|uniref:hypothetical protein n=1 Tax=Phyllobacterium TaxID=28100 RepID=UPI0010297C07|nr:hypothetical protein [Phyllobacterium myrsinacearum]RZS88473.1 hypothetical protein EV217_0859 [Phyllobacterium myrsinacearum]